MKSKLFVFLSKSNITDRKMLIACFSLGVAVRLVPELLAWPLPIGWDTIYYAFVMKSGVIISDWSGLFRSGWLLYSLIVPLYNLSQVDPFLLLKIFAPLLFGLNTAGVYWFARKMLGWNFRVSFFAVVFFAIQLASLRISWDLLRNTLGLGILLFAVAYSKESESMHGLAIFVLLSLLSVFAHEYAAVILIVTVLGSMIWGLIKRRTDLLPKRIIIGILPAVALFLVSTILRLYFPPTETRYIETGDAVDGRVGSPFFLVNYLQIQTSVDSYANYGILVFNVAVLFAVLFLPYLFLIVKGFFRNGFLDYWTVLLSVGAFGCLVIPFCALEYWHRWMFMLVYPFTFYAINGLREMYKKFPGCSFVAVFPWQISRKATYMALLTFGLGCAYLATPFLAIHSASLPLVTAPPQYFSVAPTVPYQDVYAVEQTMAWLDEHMTPDSAALLHHVFLSWGLLYLDSSHSIVHFEINASAAVTTAINTGFSKLFFVWWNTSPGWFNVSIPEGFVRVQEFSSISIYEYEVGQYGGS